MSAVRFCRRRLADLGVQFRLVRAGVGGLDQGLDRIVAEVLDRRGLGLEIGDHLIDTGFDRAAGIVRFAFGPWRGIKILAQLARWPPARGHLTIFEDASQAGILGRTGNALERQHDREEDPCHVNISNSECARLQPPYHSFLRCGEFAFDLVRTLN